ncbi:MULTISPECIES: helicase HerA-like C-terminal domain-containing protein [unclassified Polaromonas]|jgi:DNA helicase HerA-like ATPase|uniref:helicase HerA-like C-terminal domain-containing protein n=3 Tax=Polaromonas TaxID=52972 RepID=UPI000BDA2D88|nr:MULTISPECIES: helicase HerA-like C-terminal domain-containing protein [unclassified Polaromonas]OYY39202.1 MAG: ATP-binding protein [Polaromonas sp. 35-63-35]OYZ22068.1 MAG: ATP-binding protein [Polaromonas sp. 16-63-31]OYZ80507.1 MAG: ATP-binding protein [Polaromonas sp. 24-63-21]OZA51568.1 MAG: ATP-binding protein [Polaromonas sp. 17-63-33]OZA89959.1 MAG: ATP-binding protein [Polaromonas sp. 39-63-25]
MAEPFLIARNASTHCELLPGLANRHGLITGATGTGKTVTLQALAENFSKIGVPVFMADVKGDLAGISQAGNMGEKMAAVLKERGIDKPVPLACPTTLWDVFGEQGHPVRATVSDMGPLLLGRMLGLNETQAGVINLVFKIADDNGMLLLDLKDLRAMLQYVGDNGSQFTTQYGNISAASVGAIQRGLMQIETQGGDKFFGEPMLDISDFMQTVDGKGVVNILAADKLMNSPRLYATFLLWMLSELFEQLPEIGDPDKPKLVFFFDEAHLLFDEAPKALIERIELVVRLVRSKGVGVYFVTQNPLDIPDSVLAQLGNRVQHALRAYTPRDQKAVKATAQTMRQKPGLDIETAITELAVGEALVSFLDSKGRPSVTERAYVLPPGSQIGPITPQQRQALMQGSLVAGVYEKHVDRESAHEMLKERAEVATAEAAKAAGGGAAGQSASGGILGGLNDVLFGSTGPRGGRREGLAESMAKSAVRTMGSTVGREIIRGVLGGLFGSKKR